MHEEVLTKEQKELLSPIRNFSGQFGLVGGTAIALQIGHRRSIDFDLFSNKRFFNTRIQDQIRDEFRIEKVFVDRPNELTILVNKVKITFYKYPFNIKYQITLKNIIKTPDLLTLASMKSFALGRRAKWKDYVDLYFLFKRYSLSEISKQAKKIFKGEFNEKLLREQLAYFEDIDYSEKVEFMPGKKVSDQEIKETLTEVSLSLP